MREKKSAEEQCDEACEALFELIQENSNRLPDHPTALGYALLALGASMLRLEGLSEDAVREQAVISFQHPRIGCVGNPYDPDYEPSEEPS